MEIHTNCNDKIHIDYLTLQKMAFINNALENGWEIKKNDEKYTFTKKHEGKKEVFLDSYLRRFIEQNVDIKTIIS